MGQFWAPVRLPGPKLSLGLMHYLVRPPLPVPAPMPLPALEVADLPVAEVAPDVEPPPRDVPLLLVEAPEPRFPVGELLEAEGLGLEPAGPGPVPVKPMLEVEAAEGLVVRIWPVPMGEMVEAEPEPATEESTSVAEEGVPSLPGALVLEVAVEVGLIPVPGTGAGVVGVGEPAAEALSEEAVDPELLPPEPPRRGPESADVPTGMPASKTTAPLPAPAAGEALPRMIMPAPELELDGDDGSGRTFTSVGATEAAAVFAEGGAARVFDADPVLDGVIFTSAFEGRSDVTAVSESGLV